MKCWKSPPDDLVLAMSVFQVRPDWYEEYWLGPETSPSPARSRPGRWILRFIRSLTRPYVRGRSCAEANSKLTMSAFAPKQTWSPVCTMSAVVKRTRFTRCKVLGF
jgi:hypothetical protein